MPNAKEIRLGELTDLDTFGEDALISGQPRNVSITAVTDVSLLRLRKEQFLTLIKQPALKYISYSELKDLVSLGAELIDVREPDEYKKNHLPNSINIPFFTLRMQMKTLNRQKPIVVICWDGKASETASFILVRHKFNALVLLGGTKDISPDLFEATASFQIDDGVETASYLDLVEPGLALPSTELTTDSQEIAKLRATIEDLKTHCAIIEAEKKALQQQCSALSLKLNALELKLKSIKSS